MTTFAPEIVAAVTGHMNGDHPEDNLLIVRAAGHANVDSAVMTDVTATQGVWLVHRDGAEHEVRIPWSEPISERAEIRREVVVLYREACAKLGLTPREH